MRRDPRPKPERNYHYYEQQDRLDIIAQKYGVVAFRPDYHGASGDKNTVLFYTLEDHKHNCKVDRQPTKYTRSEAADRPYFIGDEYIYRDCFWWFENSDVNDQFDYDFANFGKLDLKDKGWEERLEGAILISLIKHKEAKVAAKYGGVDNLPEACEEYNDLNRELIKAYKLRYGKVFYADIYYPTTEREKLMDGSMSIYKEWNVGDKFYNFAARFLLPEKDQQIEELVREWNRYGKVDCLCRIWDRVEKVGGTLLVWS